MDFKPSPEVATLRERILDFMDAEIYPQEREIMEALDAEVGARRPLPEDPGRDPREGEGRGALEPLHARRALRPGPDATGSTACSARRWAAARWRRRWPSTAPRRTPATWRSSPSTARAEQRERWLEPLLEGRIRSCFSMTEPEVSGSDPTLLQARAVLDGDEWVIDGHKWFTSGAVGADAGDRDGRHRPRRANPTRAPR